MRVFGQLFIAVLISLVVGFTGSMVYAEGATSASGYQDTDEDNTTSASGYQQDTDAENDDVVSADSLVEQEEIEVIGTGNTYLKSTSFINQESGNLSCGGILLGRAIGTVSGDTGTPTGAVSEGDRLGFMLGRGYDGGNWQNGAGFTIKVDGAVTSGSVPARFTIETGSTFSDRQDRLVVKSDGKIGIGTTDPGYDLDVVGNINFTGNLYQKGSLFSSGDGNGGTTSVWETFGTDIYYNSGNVGIGTTSPGVKLEVDGNIIANTPAADNHLATKAYVDAASGGGCYVSYSGSCLNGFTSMGSAGSWGNCGYSGSGTSPHFRPPGGGCSGGWYNSSTVGTAYVCCQ